MKQNDQIKCINQKGSTFLCKGEVYEIVNVNSYGNIRVKDLSDGEISTHWYKPDRFVLLSESKPIHIDVNKEYQTRGGDKVKILAISQDAEYPVVGQLFDPSSQRWYNTTWTKDGQYFYGHPIPDPNDLVEVKKPVVLSCEDHNITIYPDRSAHFLTSCLNTSLSSSEMQKLVDAWNGFSS